MKILLTGAAGQLGQALQQALKDHEVTACDRDALDIADQAQVEQHIQSTRPDLLINAAAYTQVDKAEEDQAAAYRVNETGAALLAQATADMSIPIVQVSTDYVFDGSSKAYWLESDETHPLSVYGKSKLAGEQAVQTANPRHSIVRTAWLYHHSGENFLRTMYALRDREEVRVVDDQRGSPTNADDLADAIAQLVETQDYGVHHLVNSGDATWYELTCEFYRQLDIRTRVVPVSTAEFQRPAPRPASSVLKSGRDNGISLPDWQAGVARLVRQIRTDPW